MGQNQPGGFQDDGVPSAAPPPELTTITGVGVPGDGTTRLDEAEASPAQEALDQARVQQLTPDSHDELVSNAADNDERRAARDGRAQYERRVRAQDEAPPPPSAAIRQAVDRAAARSPGRSVTSHSSGDAPSQEEAPSEYMCPITLSMMADPVVANDGHSYERAAIAHWLATHNTSPQTREPMVSRELVPNHALRARIAAWRTQRGLDPLPARWIPPQAPAPAPAPQQRQPRPTALRLTRRARGRRAGPIHGVLNRAPHLRRGRWAWPRRRARLRAAARAVAAARRRGARPLCQRRAGPPALRGRALARRRPASAHAVLHLTRRWRGGRARTPSTRLAPRRSTPSNSGPWTRRIPDCRRRRRRTRPSSPFHKASRRGSPTPSPCLRERQLGCPRPAAPCGPTTRRPWWPR